MARTPKKGLKYFPMDIDIFSDLKIRKLIKYQGGQAVTIYALLLCNIYKNGYYIKWDDELPFICSELTGFDEAYISEVIKTCLSVGLFSQKLFREKILTSKSIQERYKTICSQCRRTCNIDEYSLLKKETKPQAPAPAPEVMQTTLASYSHSLTLQEECEQLRKEDGWLETIEIIHHMPRSELIAKIDDFYLQCVADGKNSHSSMSDVKRHFNNWLRKQRQNERTSKDNKPYRELQELCNTQFALE